MLVSTTDPAALLALALALVPEALRPHLSSVDVDRLHASHYSGPGPLVLVRLSDACVACHLHGLPRPRPLPLVAREALVAPVVGSWYAEDDQRNGCAVMARHPNGQAAIEIGWIETRHDLARLSCQVGDALAMLDDHGLCGVADSLREDRRDRRAPSVGDVVADVTAAERDADDDDRDAIAIPWNDLRAVASHAAAIIAIEATI